MSKKNSDKKVIDFKKQFEDAEKNYYVSKDTDDYDCELKELFDNVYGLILNKVNNDLTREEELRDAIYSAFALIYVEGCKDTKYQQLLKSMIEFEDIMDTLRYSDEN